MSDTSRLQQLNSTELEAMMSSSDETTFHLFLDQDPGVQRLKGERERIEKDTLRLAQETMDLEPQFTSDRERLIDSCQTYTLLRKEFDSLLESLKSTLSGASPEEVLQQLRILSEQKEDQSEEVTDRFLAGKCSTEQFLSEFIEKRRDSHIFRVKSEQMSKIIRRDQPNRPRTAGFNPTPPSFPGTYPPPYLPNMAPAPQPGSRMPVSQW